MDLNGRMMDRRSFLRGSALFATAVGLTVVPAFAQEQQQQQQPPQQQDPEAKPKEKPKDPFDYGDKPEDQMKLFDLMHQVNTRGTFLCSQKAIPHLKRADNPHILNLAPPLAATLRPKWFAPHLAYTMAKYGMSLCTYGMAEEFKNDGIAVNALWPRTAIDTEAIRVISGEEVRRTRTRRVEIVADAAHFILTRPSRTYTGRFLIDDNVMKEAGVTDLSRYLQEGARADDLMGDFFL